MTHELSDAQHNHDERSALRRHHAEDIQSIAKALGFDPENPKHTIPFMMGVLQRAVDDARSWRQSQRKR